MNFQTPLCELAYRYGSDKCPQLGHSYTPFYSELFKDKTDQVKKVVELGIGSSETMPWAKQQRSQYVTGASLFMWRDFFPNAQIYGVDYHPSAQITSDRITSFQLNTKKTDKLIELVKEIGNDIDLFVDDGDHRQVFQVRTAQAIIPLLNPNSVYIIEDSSNPDNLVRCIPEFDCQIIKFGGTYSQNNLPVVQNNLIIVRKK